MSAMLPTPSTIGRLNRLFLKRVLLSSAYLRFTDQSQNNTQSSVDNHHRGKGK